jgi:hypothetical protein
LYRQTRLLGVLLILQVVALVGIGVHLFLSVDWDRIFALANEQTQTLPKPLEQRLEEAILFIIFFVPPAVMLLLAGLGFVLLRRRGWLLASVAQSVTLLACLFFYPEPRPGFTYPIIAYCILMVLYLNSQGVRAVFHSKKMTLASGGRRLRVADEASLDARTAETLLRRFEPVIRFTKGEWFYPMDVEPYVRTCGLWVRHPEE